MPFSLQTWNTIIFNFYAATWQHNTLWSMHVFPYICAVTWRQSISLYLMYCGINHFMFSYQAWADNLNMHYQNWVIFPPSVTWCNVLGTNSHPSLSLLLSGYHTKSSRRHRNIPVVTFLAPCQTVARHISSMWTKWCSLLEENNIWFLHCGRGPYMIGILSFDTI